jgi:hypothetical protein
MGLPVAKIGKALQVTLQRPHRRLVALRRDGHGIAGPRLRPKYDSHDGVRDEVRAGRHSVKRLRIETLAHIDLAKVGKSTSSMIETLTPRRRSRTSIKSLDSSSIDFNLSDSVA